MPTNKTLQAIKNFFSEGGKKFDPNTHTLVAKPITDVYHVAGIPMGKIKLRIIDIIDNYDDNLLEKLNDQCEQQAQQIRLLARRMAMMQEKIENHKAQMSAQLHYFKYLENEAIKQLNKYKPAIENLEQAKEDLNKNIEQIKAKHTDEISAKDEKIKEQKENWKQLLAAHTKLKEEARSKKEALQRKLSQAGNSSLENEIKEYRQLYKNVQNEKKQLQATINALKEEKQKLKVHLLDYHVQDQLLLQQSTEIEEQRFKIKEMEYTIKAIKKAAPANENESTENDYQFASDINKHLYHHEEKGQSELKLKEYQKKLEKKNNQIQLLQNEIRILLSKLVAKQDEAKE